MVLLRLLPLLCIFLFILLQSVSINIKTESELTVKINFNIFAITFSRGNDKKRRRIRPLKLFRNIESAYKSLRYLLGKSHVVIREYEKVIDVTATEGTLINANISTFTRIILFYINANSKSIRFVKNTDEGYGQGVTAFDVTFHFSLFHMINSALIFTYYIVKNKAKRVIKNV